MWGISFNILCQVVSPVSQVRWMCPDHTGSPKTHCIAHMVSCNMTQSTECFLYFSNSIYYYQTSWISRKWTIFRIKLGFLDKLGIIVSININGPLIHLFQQSNLAKNTHFALAKCVFLTKFELLSNCEIQIVSKQWKVLVVFVL